MANPPGQGAADGLGVVPSITMPPARIVLADPPLVSALLGSLNPETINAWILCVGIDVKTGVALGVDELPGGLEFSLSDGLGVDEEGGGAAEISVCPLPGAEVSKSPVVGRLRVDAKV